MMNESNVGATGSAEHQADHVPRIVYFTTAHSPTDIRIFVKELRTLAANGYDVTMVVPNAPTAPIDNVKFVDFRPPKGGRARRVVLAPFAMLRLLMGRRADVYHFCDPELLGVAVLLRCLGRRVIYDAHEHLRDDLRSKPYLGGIVRWFAVVVVGSLEWLASRLVNHIIAATPTIAQQFPPRKTTVVHNYPIVSEMPSGAFSFESYGDRETVGVYVGSMSPLRHSNEMFVASDNLARSWPGFRLDVAGPTFRTDDPSTHDGVRYHGVVSRSDVADLLSNARFGIMLLADVPNCADGQPNKFFEYAAVGLPVVVSRSTKAITEIVNHFQIGLAVDETSPSAIEAGMRWMLENPREAYEMGQRASKVVEDSFSWEGEVSSLLGAYSAALGEGRS
jgi:glycosyltransferase involved in cell wall biosynthesis